MLKINNDDSTLQVELISLDEAAKLLLGDAHNTSVMRSNTMINVPCSLSVDKGINYLHFFTYTPIWPCSQS